MKRKDIAEIKKQLSPANCAITRMCTCYVNAEKEKLQSWSQSFLSLEEELEFKYLELFKKTLSGGLNKLLHNIEFPQSEEAVGGAQEFLLRLKESKLKDESLVQEFFDKIIHSFNTTDHYYITLTHSVYDVPGKASDGALIEDSDNVHEYISCTISPLELKATELFYNEETKSIERSTGVRTVGKPVIGFMFPAFDERETNIHELLFYTKKNTDMQEEFLDAMFGCVSPESFKAQKELYQSWLEDSIGRNGCIEVVTTMNDVMADLVEQDECCKLTGDNLELLLRELDTSLVPKFRDAFREIIGERELSLSNLIDKNLTLNIGEIAVKASDMEKHNVEVKKVGARRCIVIPVSDCIDVNGVVVGLGGLDEDSGKH